MIYCPLCGLHHEPKRIPEGYSCPECENIFTSSKEEILKLENVKLLNGEVLQVKSETLNALISKEIVLNDGEEWAECVGESVEEYLKRHEQG